MRADARVPGFVPRDLEILQNTSILVFRALLPRQLINSNLQVDYAYIVHTGTYACNHVSRHACFFPLNIPGPFNFVN